MKRRCFLASTAAATALLASGSTRPVIAGRGPASVAVVITDISAFTTVDMLLSVVGAFVKRGINLTCCLALPKDDALEKRFAQTVLAMKRLGGGVDFAIQLPDLAMLSPHFQSRTVFEARARLIRLIGAKGGPIVLESVLCEEVETPASPIGIRSSGFRNVLVRPKNNQQVRSETWPNGVVRFFGGQLIEPGSSLSLSADQVSNQNQLLLYLSANALDHVADDKLKDWAGGFVDGLLKQEMMGQTALMSVPDMQLRDYFQLQRLVTVLLDFPKGASESDTKNALAFQDQLAKTGIASVLKDSGSEFWVQRNGEDPSLVPVVMKCQPEGTLQLGAAGPIRLGHGLRFSDSDISTFGIDGCAMLNLPVTRLPDRVSGPSLTKLLTGSKDIVLAVSSEQIKTPAARRSILASILALREDGVTSFAGLFEFTDSLVAQGHIETRHRQTIPARAIPKASQARAIDEAERARLMEDARHAWQFFDKHTNGTTGLSPATVNSRKGGGIHQAVTMWDVGSNINALVAAAELGLIDEKRLEKSINRILPNISGRSSQGRLLPQGWIRTDRHRWGNSNFDGCDAGRLMAALDNLRRRFGMNKKLEKLVNSWDFKDVIINREIHSVTDRELITTYGSHCAHYSALAFRRWGLDVASPYETFADRASADGEVALLEASARIGPLGTEPLLLEAVELGMSQESGYLADVLFTALQEEYASSGRLLCVSETPIDRTPWFIYQGLQLGTGPREWRLDTVGHQPQYLTEEAAQEYLSFSTKAAFLWAAYMPGEHSDRLLAFARKHGQNGLGFASSVNLKTLKTTSGYTDINTNAIILQAIAHMLRNPAK